jgi:hypothetical protein
MICEGAAVLNFFASALMNGVCCMHSMEQEERRNKETRETLRQMISVEYERQRLLEREHFEKLWREHGLDTSLVADDRRRLYLAAKMAARDSSSSISKLPSNCESSLVMNEQTSDETDNLSLKTLPNSLIPSRRHILNENKELCTDGEDLDTRTRSAPEVRDYTRHSLLVPIVMESPSHSHSITSSLLDDFQSDSDDELDIIPLG